MKTDYPSHDIAYQRKRQDPEYSGWGKAEDFADGWQLLWQPLMQRDAFPKQGKLLELGCGAGNLSISFAQVGYETIGIDISPTAIEWAIANATKANVSSQFIQGSVLTLDGIPDESFDVALDGHCFHCIIGRDRAQFLQSAYRILKTGGVLAICSMCNQVPTSTYFLENFDPKTRCLMHNGVAVRYIGDSNDIIQEVIAASFRILDVKLIPPQDDEDLADLQILAEKK